MNDTESTPAEMGLAAASAGLIALALGGPFMADAASHHTFADGRMLWGITNAMDVLSNLGFAVAALVGLLALLLARPRALTNMQRAMALMFFLGLGLVAIGSTAFHLDPHRASLAVDRACMAFPMAALLGLIAAGHVSERAGAATGLGALAFGLAAAQLHGETGNVLPWVTFQFGGMVLLGWLAMLPRRERALPVRWGLLLAIYAAAKLLELNDQAVFEASGHLVSGHALKHLVAALAAVPVIAAIVGSRRPRQNASQPAAADDAAIRWAHEA